MYGGGKEHALVLVVPDHHMNVMIEMISKKGEAWQRETNHPSTLGPKVN